MKALNRTLQMIAFLGAIASGFFFFSADKSSKSMGAELEEATNKLQFERSKASTLSKTLSVQKTALETYESDLAEAKSEIASLSAQRNQLQRENRRFGDQQENQAGVEERLQNENARLSQELAKLRANSVPKEQVASYETKIATIERELLEMQQTQSRVVSPNIRSTPDNPTLTGRVLTVGKEASFVVLDIGYSSGVRLKNELTIQHADSPIAKIQVTEVKENLSIARVLPESLIKTPQPGDTVSSLN